MAASDSKAKSLRGVINPQNKIVKKKQEKRRYVSISIFLYITLSVSSSSEFDFLKIFLMFSYKKVSCL